MKLLLVSDEESRFIWDYFDPSVFKGVELIVSCGDLSASYLEFLVSMIPVPLIYVPGNHDKGFLVSPPEGCVNIDGIFYRHKNVNFFGMGGSKSESLRAYEYSEKVMAKRLSKKRAYIKRNGGVDVFVTHAPALGLGDSDDAFHQGFAAYRAFLEEFRPKYHFFGHVHKRYGAAIPTRLEYEGTILMNACGYNIVDIDI